MKKNDDKITFFACGRGQKPKAKCMFKLTGKLEGEVCGRPLKSGDMCPPHQRLTNQREINNAGTE